MNNSLSRTLCHMSHLMNLWLTRSTLTMLDLISGLGALIAVLLPDRNGLMLTHIRHPPISLSTNSIHQMNLVILHRAAFADPYIIGWINAL